MAKQKDTPPNAPVIVLEAVEPKARLEVEGEDVRRDARMLRDERLKQKEGFKIWDDEGEAARLG